MSIQNISAVIDEAEHGVKVQGIIHDPDDLDMLDLLVSRALRNFNNSGGRAAKPSYAEAPTAPRQPSLGDPVSIGRSHKQWHVEATLPNARVRLRDDVGRHTTVDVDRISA